MSMGGKLAMILPLYVEGSQIEQKTDCRENLWVKQHLWRQIQGKHFTLDPCISTESIKG